MSPDSQSLCSDYVPRTALGKKLLKIRNRAIAKGMKLLSVEEIGNEVEDRRGEK